MSKSDCGRRVTFTRTRFKKSSTWPCSGEKIDEESRKVVQQKFDDISVTQVCYRLDR
jgi:hypothetical protein